MYRGGKTMKNSGRGGDNPDPDPEKVHVNHGTEVFKGSETAGVI